MKNLKIIGTIGRETRATDFVKETGPIQLDIDSLGGDLTEAAAIVNSLTDAESVEVCYSGFSASAATLIGSSFANVSIYDNVQILIHESRGGAEGTKTDIQAYADFLEQTNNQMAEIYAKKTGKEKTFWREIMAENNGEGRWLMPAEALELGLVNEIKPSFKAAASLDYSIFEKMGLKKPEINSNQLINEPMEFNLFGKKTEKPKAVKTDKGILICTELKVGAKVVSADALASGESTADGEYTTDDKKMTVKNEEIIEISEIEPVNEMAAENEMLKAKIAELEAKLAEFVTAKAEIETVKAELAEANAKIEVAAKYIPVAQKTPEKTPANPKANVSMNAYILAKQKEVAEKNKLSNI